MSRYVSHDQLHLSEHADSKGELTRSLSRIVGDFPPKNHYHRRELAGFYSGPTSIALLFFHLSVADAGLIVNGHKASEWCELYLSHEGISKGDVDANHCGIANETLCHLALTAISSPSRSSSAIENFLSYIPPLLKSSSSSSSYEHLYGLAGTLYLLRLIQHFTPSDSITPSLSSNITAAISDTATTIIASGPDWRWHGKSYAGAIHGSIGIITQVLLSLPPSSPHTPQLLPWLSTLLSTLDSGNFPSSLGSERDELVQFCHGGPGVVLCLLAIRKLASLPDDLKGKIDEVVEKARTDIWERGVLRKAPCLCHGTTGNAIAMDKGRRESMMRWATEDNVKDLSVRGRMQEDMDGGLYTGEAGRAWAWMVELGWAEGMVGFSDV